MCMFTKVPFRIINNGHSIEISTNMSSVRVSLPLNPLVFTSPGDVSQFAEYNVTAGFACGLETYSKTSIFLSIEFLYLQ